MTGTNAYPSAILFTTNPTMPELRMGPGLGDYKPASTQLLL